MDVLFLDANIFFAAAASKTGGSYFIFKLAERKKVRLVSNSYALREAKRNICLKLKEQNLIAFYNFASLLEKVDTEGVFSQEIVRFANIIVSKDAPILASALRQKADFLITLDKKDFMAGRIKNAKLKIKIATPGEFLRNYLKQVP